MDTQKIVDENQGLVVKVAQRFAGRGIEIDDLIQYGNVGLIESLKTFDAQRGKLSTHAVPRIAHEMRRALENHRAIPTYVSAMMPAFLTARNRLQSQLGRAPTMAEIRPHVDVSDADWKKLEAAHQFASPSSIDGGADAETAYQFKDESAANPADLAAQDEERASLRAAVAALPDRLRLVITMRFGLDDGIEKRLDDVAAALDVSRERARQLEVAALDALRELPLTVAA